MKKLIGFFPALKNLFRTESSRQPDPARVFIVHGRNEALRRSLYDFLRAIGLKPMEWNQALLLAGAPSPYIGEVIDDAMQQAQALVILLSGDDETRLKAEFSAPGDSLPNGDFIPQPRQNVVFESGLALGKYPRRTVLVQIGQPRLFSDISGRHIVRLDNSIKTRQALAQRLMLAGCPVDLSGTDWHDAGHFQPKE